MNYSKKIYKNDVYINKIILTTSEDVPLMYKPIFTTREDIYIKVSIYTPWGYNKEIYNTLAKLEEKYLVKVIHEIFKSIPKKFNRIVRYNLIQYIPSAKIIDCTND
jgi:hypothetical protein